MTSSWDSISECPINKYCECVFIGSLTEGGQILCRCYRRSRNRCGRQPIGSGMILLRPITSGVLISGLTVWFSDPTMMGKLIRTAACDVYIGSDLDRTQSIRGRSLFRTTKPCVLHSRFPLLRRIRRITGALIRFWMTAPFVRDLSGSSGRRLPGRLLLPIRITRW